LAIQRVHCSICKDLFDLQFSMATTMSPLQPYLPPQPIENPKSTWIEFLWGLFLNAAILLFVTINTAMLGLTFLRDWQISESIVLIGLLLVSILVGTAILLHLRKSVENLRYYREPILIFLVAIGMVQIQWIPYFDTGKLEPERSFVLHEGQATNYWPFILFAVISIAIGLHGTLRCLRGGRHAGAVLGSISSLTVFAWNITRLVLIAFSSY
jgi:uncharacterized integral membrane protein